MEQYSVQIDPMSQYGDNSKNLTINTKFRNFDQHYDAFDQLSSLDQDLDVEDSVPEEWPAYDEWIMRSITQI